jgi:hypothetical protein
MRSLVRPSSVQRSDGRWLEIGDRVASPEFGGRGIIKEIRQTKHGAHVIVSFEDPSSASGQGYGHEHAFTPDELVRDTKP